MFARGPALPFSVVAAVSALLGLTTLWWWRDVEGRVAHVERPRST